MPDDNRQPGSIYDDIEDAIELAADSDEAADRYNHRSMIMTMLDLYPGQMSSVEQAAVRHLDGASTLVVRTIWDLIEAAKGAAYWKGHRDGLADAVATTDDEPLYSDESPS
jgi:hypothetical protein